MEFSVPQRKKGGIVPVNVADEMKQAYGDYALAKKEEVFVDQWGRAWVPQNEDAVPMGGAPKSPVDPRAVILEERTPKEEAKIKNKFRAIFRHFGNRLSIG